MKISQKNLIHMWKDKSRANVVNGSFESYAKKAIDDLCLKADLAETTWDYTYEICNGMLRLYKMGLRPEHLLKHQILVQKLLNLGRDIMDYALHETDLFYLGVFIDLKMLYKWKQMEFFKFICSALIGIKNYFAFFSKTLKTRLIREFQKEYPNDYERYFNLRLSSA